MAFRSLLLEGLKLDNIALPELRRQPFAAHAWQGGEQK
jgi:hypothetical protein